VRRAVADSVSVQVASREYVGLLDVVCDDVSVLVRSGDGEIDGGGDEREAVASSEAEEDTLCDPLR
jgi:hypothetical protein